MKLCKKITGVIAKAAEVVCMAMISVLVLAILIELLRRNFMNQSFGGNVQLCGIAFLWMAFIGLIPLYHDSGLMRLDFLVSKLHGAAGEAIWFANKAFSLILGVVMVIAFVAQYPFISTRYYPTFSIQIPYTVQYFPMALAGAYIAVKTVEQVVERILVLTGKTEREG